MLLFKVSLVILLIILAFCLLIYAIKEDLEKKEYCPTCGCNLNQYHSIKTEFYDGHIRRICPECGGYIITESNE